MAIPLKYNARNLLVRKVSTGMTVLGISLVVSVFLLLMSLAEGVRRTLTTTVSARNLVVMRVGSQSEAWSYVNRDQYEAIRTLPDLERDAQGNLLVSPELVVLINLTRRDGKRTNVMVRGVEATALALRDGMRVVEGRPFRSGTSEAIVSRRLRGRFAGMDLGATIKAGSERWTVVGIFDAAGSPYDSEIWADLHDVQAQADRGTGSSIVLARATDAAARDRLVAAIKGDQRIKLDALPEDRFYQAQMGTAQPIRYLAWFVAIVMAVGASFGAMNTMYAQVAARTREVATMRALGFSRLAVLASFVLESLALGLAGGILGGGVAWALVRLLLTAPTGTSNFTTFAEILFNFELTPRLLLVGVVFSTLIGLFGGLLPAARASRSPITSALREA